MTETLQLLAFLYASMPLPDSVDYSREYWLQNIESTLQARKEMTWGTRIPEREFRHFVLPVRVNNENLDESRWVFYDELKERIKGLSMSDAILEVNHWCHEKVTYQPSDERTSSPLATVKSAIGRCGEESTFLVSALRSVCIPARQVYTPRWAHTDDNHAWVEAWADGEWHFLGACEPEAVLDLGWFNAPASRGMLMHTKAFGHYDGPEEVMEQTACYTEIDVTANYAPVAKAYAKVVDAEGKAVKGAKVEFKIYNYAEFYTVSTKETDANGVTYMQAGKGDLVAWAYKDGRYGFSRFPVSEGDTIEVVLNHKSGETYSFDMEIVPPKERNTLPPMTEAQRLENTRRLAVEDSIRNAYVASFPASCNLSMGEDASFAERTERLIKASRGNYQTLIDYLQFVSEMYVPAFGLNLLESLSAKDLRDVEREVLDDNTRWGILPALLYDTQCPDSIFTRYILCPRVANERLTPYRSQLFEAMGVHSLEEMETCFMKHWEQGAEELVRWVSDSIQIDRVHNPQQLCMSPLGVYKHRVTDSHSRDIFFVAMARTFGFPSRIDPVTGKVQYMKVGEWQWKEVRFDRADELAEQKGQGPYMLLYEPDGYLTDPKYYTHFTLSKIENGRPKLLNFGEEDTWSSIFTFDNNRVIDLDEGDYLLTTGTRMADGSVLVHIEVEHVEKESISTVLLKMRHAEEGLQVIGALNAEHLYKDEAKGECSILSTTGRGFYVLGMIVPNNEPTNHTLRDIAQYREALDEWGGTLLLLFRNEDEAARFRKEEFPALPQKTVFGIDHTGAILDELTRELHLSGQNLPEQPAIPPVSISPGYPLFVIADTFNRIVFCSEGYTIGLGERLVKGLMKLKS